MCSLFSFCFVNSHDGYGELSTSFLYFLVLYLNNFQVLLSQCSGSNRGGFSVVSTAKGAARLDGVFNIISYDSVAKLQGTLISSEFKVNTSDLLG